MKYALIKVEKSTLSPNHGSFGGYLLTEPCFIFLGEYETVEAAKNAQKEYEDKTIIIQIY